MLDRIRRRLLPSLLLTAVCWTAILTGGLPLGTMPVSTAGLFFWGQCTWWAALKRPDIGAKVSGNARQWTYTAMQAGLSVGTEPKLNAIAVFQPGVQGAGWYGHVAHVNVVSPDGVSFGLDEANWFGLGLIDLRMAHAGPGVEFVYG